MTDLATTIAALKRTSGNLQKHVSWCRAMEWDGDSTDEAEADAALLEALAKALEGAMPMWQGEDDGHFVMMLAPIPKSGRKKRRVLVLVGVNICNASRGEGFQIQCGELDGFSKAKTEGAAFREIKRKHKRPVLGDLARFRMVRFRPNSRFAILTPWFYQEPKALEKTP